MIPDNDGNEKGAVVNAMTINGESGLNVQGDYDINADGLLLEPVQPPKFSDIFKFTMIFWVLCVSCVCVYGTCSVVLVC
jgi:hypothetical protein